MELVYIILPFALLLAAIALVAFIWAAKSGQFDDLETPGRRVLLDDVEDVKPEQANASDSQAAQPKDPN
jgi:cbb3-type cytochrome oxidase maturation protein